MKGFFLRPETQGAFTLIGLTSAGLLTGVPLVVRSLAPRFYIVLLCLLLFAQAGQVASFWLAETERRALRQSMSQHLQVTGGEAVRRTVVRILKDDPLRKLHDLEINWAVRVRDIEDRTLLKISGGLEVDQFNLLHPTSTSIRIVQPNAESDRPQPNCNFYGGCQAQGVTGFRFEVFYVLPKAIPERDGRVLGGTLLEQLRCDEMLGLIATRI